MVQWPNKSTFLLQSSLILFYFFVRSHWNEVDFFWEWMEVFGGRQGRYFCFWWKIFSCMIATKMNTDCLLPGFMTSARKNQLKSCRGGLGEEKHSTIPPLGILARNNEKFVLARVTSFSPGANWGYQGLKLDWRGKKLRGEVCNTISYPNMSHVNVIQK